MREVSKCIYYRGYGKCTLWYKCCGNGTDVKCEEYKPSEIIQEEKEPNVIRGDHETLQHVYGEDESVWYACPCHNQELLEDRGKWHCGITGQLINDDEAIKVKVKKETKKEEKKVDEILDEYEKQIVNIHEEYQNREDGGGLKEAVRKFIEGKSQFKQQIHGMIRVALEKEMEALADIEHQRWASWQKYLHEKLKVCLDGNYYLHKDWRNRWFKQIITPYKDLSEREKESDRKEVRRYMKHILAVLESEFKGGER